jgi:hypothetical protein
MIPAIYVSGDALERADAYRFGYRTVCWHPREIGVPEVSDTLVIDCGHVLFDDYEHAVACAKAAAARGVLVGIHTYYPQALELYGLVGLPNVLVAKNHRLLLRKLARHARRHGRSWPRTAKRAQRLKSEVTNVHDNHDDPDQGTSRV